MTSASSKRASSDASAASHSRRSGASGNRASAVGEHGSQAVLVTRVVARLETIEDLVEAVAHDTSPSRVPAMVTASSLVASPRAAAASRTAIGSVTAMS